MIILLAIDNVAKKLTLATIIVNYLERARVATVRLHNSVFYEAYVMKRHENEGPIEGYPGKYFN